MADTKDLSAYEPTFDRIREARAQAVHHARLANRFAAERRELMQGLLEQGVSQSDIARALGVSRQAVQKMLAVPAS
ncbi:helix-turn-helix domain-containing protein [Streptomyces sp. NPDC088354]|uniref:helix-turn-helix domain-containing protein n=1 Tax=unclassified Streptomyces TaxID=2593676 RepID=UPI0029AE951F|nr:helix-turn-helix domain-containing protein [Streptomyces sp. MI02-7b]MDX3073829.1 helix-turn-helix domain-containing protein [Streptomyces sp. MI02-7b]